jgi:hypothetical protein
MRNGTIQSFTVGPEGAISLVDTFSSGGSGPEYCAGLSTGQVAVTNVRVFATSYNGFTDRRIVQLWYSACRPHLW